ncbi:hypothetical protein U732_1131 [Clostridium argentinense CDC 2741]|uniref:Uncharacterized protein n=1 Tax=Clostridium argentinense CDC 2741 TaxID=1418104 RepID=A0A0C1R8R6_9CLOT|nr:hypothetical protein [Clostridium argentinense]ARC85635.1 hypothetical protein RSJ17_14535 [Clostridium argentinense]KIE46911.1 hypothetical protein U732_1131 [Clostridium argentinense CDC 2741]NFF40844.1 hypothetical protein [Clostridium argentinense]NFP50776.1 hypothetical protein [Clostridium argentinense]NFP73067.1 hypothetical protein [Clostridium argentinense]
MSLPKYIINFNELTDDLKGKTLELIDDELKDKCLQLSTHNIEGLLEDLKESLPNAKYEGLKNKIDKLIQYTYEGTQKIKSKLLDIPAIKNNYNVDFIFDKDVFLTGIHFNQTGWKKEDRWNLVVNKNKIIDESTIKEIGEHKYFNTYHKVNANTPISFILHNNSGNSRQVMIDLEYIEGKDSTIIVEQEVTTIEDIPNDWDIAVVMQWEETKADLDLHGVMGNTHVYYGNRQENSLFLNFDYREHITNNNPEILSVKNKNKKLDVYINNFNEVELKETVNIKIYNKRKHSNKLLKEFAIKIGRDKKIAYGVCEIDLKTLGIREIKDKDIKLLGGR